MIEEATLNPRSVCRTIQPIRYAGDVNDGYSTDDESHLSRNQRAVYFTSGRVIRVHFPLTPEQAEQKFKRLEGFGWFTDYANAWSLSLALWSNADNPGKSDTSK